MLSDLRKCKSLEHGSPTETPSIDELSVDSRKSMPAVRSPSEGGDGLHCSRWSSSMTFEKDLGSSSPESKECKMNQTSLKPNNLVSKSQVDGAEVIFCKEEVVDEEMEQSGESIQLPKKKRLNARAFRKSFSLNTWGSKNSGDNRHTEVQNKMSRSNGASHNRVVKDFVERSSSAEVGNSKYINSIEEDIQYVEISSCESDDGKAEHANFIRTQNLHFDEVQDLESSGHLSSASDCSLPIASVDVQVRDAQQVQSIAKSRISGLDTISIPEIKLTSGSACQVTAECIVSDAKKATDVGYEVLTTSSSTKACIYKTSGPCSPRTKKEYLGDIGSPSPNPERITTVPDTTSFCEGKFRTEKLSFCQDSTNGAGRPKVRHEEQEYLLENRDDENITCAKCKLGGMLLSCGAKGCFISFHLVCHDPPLSVVPLGAWYCHACIIKKVKLGIYLVSPGMEAIFDSKDISIEGKLERQYFVKFKGLAHIHNCWVPEWHVLEEAPTLIEKFKRRGRNNKALLWSSDWLIPQRLLNKRPIMLSNEADSLTEDGAKSMNLPCEWLVKWKGLGYEGSTWEFEDSPLFTSSEAMLLISDYVQRKRRAKEYSNYKRTEKLLNSRKGPLPVVSEFPGFAYGGHVKEYLASVNKILEFWYRCQNTIVIDDKERIVKIVLFILSLKPDVPFPALIISTSPFLNQWEAEFMHLDQSLNVVVYTGEKNLRKNIQMMEFSEDSGGIMFEVLISTPDAIVEDLNTLKYIASWGVIVVDGLYGSNMSEYLEQVRSLSSDFKLFIASDQIKDDMHDLFNVLSFLGEENIERVDQSDSSVWQAVLKEKLCQLVAYEHNIAQPKLIERLVPIPFSDVQLEQYCCILVENSFLLRSCLKNSSVEILSNVLKSAKECCEHPYVVNPSLQFALTKNLTLLENLYVGVSASGKLSFLDRILFEMKSQGLRVLILFQTVTGANKISIGDILDDFLRQRFGEDSYERIDRGVIKGRRDAALDKFNNIKAGRFVFLLETRACRSFIKLSSVDAVIIFGSEWNPTNDLKALMRIHIDSEFDELRLFRLYTPFTVEEKLLLASQDAAGPDSCLQNVSVATCHELLTWGAFYMFQKLDEFHDPSKLKATSETYSFGGDLNDVVREVLDIMLKNTSTKKATKQVLTEAQYNGTAYILDGSLLGQTHMEGKYEEEPPTFFWCNLLEGRSPLWKHLPETSQRTRKRTTYYVEVTTEIERDEKRTKRQKSDNSIVEPASLKIWNEEHKKANFWQKENSSHSFFSPKEMFINLGGQIMSEADESKIDDGTHDMQGSDSMAGTASTASENDVICFLGAEGSRRLRDAQGALHIQLKPVISKLCLIFRLPDNVKDMAERLLEYTMNTHHINREAKTLLDAFLLSLCWRAASLTKYKIDHDESFFLAKSLLGFECKEQEAASVYSKLKSLKKRFSKETGFSENTIISNSHGKQLMADLDQFIEKKTGVASTDHQKLGVQVRVSGCEQMEVGHFQIDDGVSEDVGQDGDCGYSPTLDTGDASKRANEEIYDQIKEIYSARSEKLSKRQQDEIMHFNDVREEVIKKLKSKYGLAVCFSSKFQKLVWHFDKCFGKLTDKQREARQKERRLKARWLQDAKAGSFVPSFDEIPLSETQFDLEEMRISSESIICEDMVDTSGPNVESGNSSILNHDGYQVSSVDFLNASAGCVQSVVAPAHGCPTPYLVGQHAASTGIAPQPDGERSMDNQCLQSDRPSFLHVDQPAALYQESRSSQVPPLIRTDSATAGDISDLSNNLLHSSEVNTTTLRPQLIPADPLLIELEKIHRERETATRMTDEEKKRLKQECEKKVEEIVKKYKSLIQSADIKLQQTQETLDINSRRVFLSVILAETYKYRSANPKVPSQPTQGMPSTFQQSCPVTNLAPPTSHGEVQAVASAPPRQVVHHSSELFSVDPPSQQLPVSRATAPHLEKQPPSFAKEPTTRSPLTSLLRQMDDCRGSAAQT